jgi:DNA-binding CsgD family transcriptional regulator
LRRDPFQRRAHLHRLFRKLGITRRSALSRALREYDCTATDTD